LSGTGWILILRLPAASPARTAFLSAADAGQLRGPFALLMYVDYAGSNCGPYRELLFIPGHVPFPDGRRHYTISRILVSTWDSVVNGRRNWGIPKDRADFVVRADEGGRREDIRVVADDGRDMCSLRMVERPLAPSFPVSSALVPSTLRTLAQRQAGRTCYYAPEARGWVRPARLLDWHFEGALFPDLREARVVTALRVRSFRLTFPLARIVD
jgi:hypothetical protein